VTLALYRGVMRALSPTVLRTRVKRGKEDPARLGERNGQASRPRPDGTLIWIHGASVGESLAALPLVSALLRRPARTVLVTTGTRSSARLMLERLPAGALHQYVPMDSRAFVRRFLAHWRPDLALFVESELWPNLILETRARGVPMALVNARLSERSFRGWRRAAGLARALLSSFDTCLAQDDSVASRLTALGAPSVRMAGSLKADATPLPVDDSALAAFLSAVGARPVFLAASTHPGEEEIILEIAEMLRRERAEMLTIIVPRHPERGKAIAELAAARKLGVGRRANHDTLTSQIAVYVADTLGELGLFYRAAPFAFLGGSLVAHGGQNPLEPARLGVGVLSGPHVENFAAIFQTLLDTEGAWLVRSKAELFAQVDALSRFPDRAIAMGARARHAAETLGGALAVTIETAEGLLAHARP
jgi:3-deoxy-D-manno-octulosonic-acid transferase